MSEHLIRLRGGWEYLPSDRSLVAIARRVTLPIDWTSDHQAGPSFQLRRGFRRPPLDERQERLTLRLERVPGLAAVRLNDQELARPLAVTEALELPLTPLLRERNLLVLEVDPARWSQAPSAWGSVALVIHAV